MAALICGSLAYDTVMVYPGRFRDHILPDKIHLLNVSFVVPTLRRNFGGCAGNIAYNLRLLDCPAHAMGTVGHDFGPLSHEVQDVLVRLDETLGLLFDALDRSVGADRYVVALTADHGVSPIPDQAKAAGFDAGRIDSAGLERRIEQVLAARLGPGKYVAFQDHTEIYLSPGIFDRLKKEPDVMDELVEAIRAWPGVWKVYRGDSLARESAGDRVALAASLSYVPERSADIILVPRPYWIASDDSAATHGTSHDYDQRVPVILMGPPFVSGEYLGPASPADVAPTLAFAVDVTLSRAYGRVLGEAVRIQRPAPIGTREP